MLRSNINTDNSDFNKIKEPEHIKAVWETIEKNIPVYFQKILEYSEEESELQSSGSFTVKTSASDIRKKIAEVFEDGIYEYEKDNEKYKKFFSDEAMKQWEDDDDSKAFKNKLRNYIPIINHAMRSKLPAMHEWQIKFSNPKNHTDVYSTFFNLITLKTEFIDEVRSTGFSSFNDLDNLATLTVLNEDDDYNVPGVIGMGIKSTVLYNLDPRYFLCSNKNNLYGFYFLSDCEHFKLPSRTNEFVMTNDLIDKSRRESQANNLIDQNYWYPYDLFTLYGLRTFRVLERICAKHNYKLSEELRFAHVNTFMAWICYFKYEVVETMTGGDQSEI